MCVSITFGVLKEQRDVAATILYEAFSEEFGKVFGSNEKTVSLISSFFQNDRVVVAIKNNLVVGVAGLKYDGKHFIDANPLKFFF